MPAIYCPCALPVVEDCPKATVRTESIISGISHEAWGSVLKTIPVVVKRVGRLTNEALVGWAVEGAPLNGCFINACAGDAELESLPTGKTDVA